MTLTYRELQWGLEPTQELKAKVYDYGADRAVRAGVCKSISYRSQKGGTWNTYKHVFERRPALIVPDTKGDRLKPARGIPNDMLSIGWLVDIELQDGRRVHAPSVLVVTDNKGSSVWLAAVGSAPRLALEQMDIGPIVTARGIEK